MFVFKCFFYICIWTIVCNKEFIKRGIIVEMISNLFQLKIAAVIYFQLV